MSNHGAHESSSEHKSAHVARLREAAKKFKANFVELLGGFTSSDASTRKMTVFFFLSLGATFWVSFQVLSHLRHRGTAPVAAASHGEAPVHGHTADAHSEEDSEKEAQKKPQAGASMLTVGAFTVDLKPQASSRKKAAGADLADVTLVLECDNTETYDYLSQRLPQLKSQITNVFIDLERDELLTREGKMKLKAKLLDRINGWIPKGKVQNVFFSKLTVG